MGSLLQQRLAVLGTLASRHRKLGPKGPSSHRTWELRPPFGLSQEGHKGDLESFPLLRFDFAGGSLA